jgi:hypothetical protein
MGSIISDFLRVSIIIADKFVMQKLRIPSQEDSERNRVAVELRGAVLVHDDTNRVVDDIIEIPFWVFVQ